MAEVVYLVERTDEKCKFVYRYGGNPYYAMWSYKQKKWIPPIDEDDYEEVFMMHNGVDVVDEETALKIIGEKQ